MEKRVAVFSTNFVPYSQTFVHDQVCRHMRYRAEVFCWRRHDPARFPFSPVHVASLAYGLTRRDASFRRRFETVRFDVVHAHFAPGAVYAAPYAKAFDVPLVVSFHGYDVPLYWNARRFHPEFWPFLFHGRAVLEQMALGLCASEELRALLVELGVPERKLRTHRLGVDVAKLHPIAHESPGSGETVLAIGRLHEQKGFEYAIRAFAAIAKSHPAARLAVIGEGELRDSLAGLARELGVEERVELVGALPHAGVVSRLQRADVVLAPSIVTRHGERDSGLIVAKEAAACEVPVIGTWHGGIHEIIDDGVTGFLVPERNTPALADRLHSLLREPELRQRMGRAARAKMIREYDIVERMRELELLYDHAIEDHGRARTPDTGRRTPYGSVDAATDGHEDGVEGPSFPVS